MTKAALLLAIFLTSACSFSGYQIEQEKLSKCPSGERPQMCTRIYAPVCGFKEVAVQCIKTPCNSILEQIKTYASDCVACSDKEVSAYSSGECI